MGGLALAVLMTGLAAPLAAQPSPPAAAEPAAEVVEIPLDGSFEEPSDEENRQGPSGAEPAPSDAPLQGFARAAEGGLLPLHGGEAGLWLLEPGSGDDRGTTVIYTGPFPGLADEAVVMRRASALRGRVTHAAPVAGGKSLWVVFEGNSVEQLMVPRPAASGRAGSGLGFMPSPAVPAGHLVRAAGVAGGSLWLVAEREDVSAGPADDPGRPEGGDSADAQSGSQPDAQPDAQSNPRSGSATDPDSARRGRLLGTVARSFEAPSRARPRGARPEGLASVGDDRLVLLGLGRRGWTRHRLPEGASEAGGSWQPLSADEDAPLSGGLPQLLHRSQSGLWTLHSPRAEAPEVWEAQAFGAGPPLAAGPLVVSDVPLWLLADPPGEAEGGVASEVGFEAIRPGAERPRTPIASLDFAENAPLLGVVSASGRAWVATAAAAPERPEEVPAWASFAQEPRAERGLSLEPIELDGARGTPRVVGVTARPTLRGVADSPLLLLVLMVATVATFLFWRRDPRRQRLRLRPRQRLAGMGPRLAAAGIDAGPGLLAAWWLLGAEPSDLAAHWPGLGRPGTPAEMLPPLLFVLVTVVHTSVSEMLSGRSLGKALLRLRVADLQGRPVRWDRALGRAALKPVDLLAVLLLVLPLINPHRQRLADLVAGTVVLGEDEAEGESGGKNDDQREREGPEEGDESEEHVEPDKAGEAPSSTR